MQTHSLLTWIVVGIALIVLPSKIHGQTDDVSSGTIVVEKDSSLEIIIKQFNEFTKRSSIGQKQPALTVDELKGSIRRQINKIPMPAQQLFSKILTTNTMKIRTKISYSTKLSSGGVEYTVWWISMTVGEYRIRIRDRTISANSEM